VKEAVARVRGFTIIELLVVMAILGVLAAAVMPLSETLIRSQQEHELQRALWDIRDAIDEYKRAVDAGALVTKEGKSNYPATLQALVDGFDDARPDAKSRHLYFLRQVPRDPFADVALAADKTWRLRSYQSPPDKPAAGEDVYDVHSSSDETALDGSSYSKW
jgi:general secretion pathway protein G